MYSKIVYKEGEDAVDEFLICDNDWEIST